MYDYSRRGLAYALRRLHRAQALRRLRRAQALRRLLPHWHLRRQLQRLKHPRWRGQKRNQLKHPRWRGQKLQLPQRRMLCPSRPSFRQQLQGQKHPCATSHAASQLTSQPASQPSQPASRGRGAS